MTGRFGPGSGSRNRADIRWLIPLSPQTPLTPSAMSPLQAGYGLCGGHGPCTRAQSGLRPGFILQANTPPTIQHSMSSEQGYGGFRAK